MVEIVKIGNKTMVVDNKLVRLFKGGKISVLAQYMGYPRFDNANNGEWSRYIKIPLTTIPNESSQYKLVITDSSLEIYSPTGSLKLSDSSSGVWDDFWEFVKNDGKDIRFFDNSFNQLYFKIEKFEPANKLAIVWFRVEPNISEVNIAYGNPRALESSFHNGYKTFKICHDFENGTSELSFTTNAYPSDEVNFEPYGKFSGKVKGGTGSEEKITMIYTFPSSGIVIKRKFIYVAGRFQGHIFAWSQEGVGWTAPHVALGRTGMSYPADPNTICYYTSDWNVTGWYVSPWIWNELMIVIDLDVGNWDLYLNGVQVVNDAGFVFGRNPKGVTTTEELIHADNGEGNPTDGYVDFYAELIPQDVTEFGTPTVFKF